MNISIRNCNNIDEGLIKINENNLNIKYAINGTGKSTIANALIAYCNDKINSSNMLLQMKPFKYTEETEKVPEISGADEITNIKIFNEQYIDDYIFQPNELVKGSFDIFIRDDNYKKRLEEINALVADIRQMFADNNDIDDLISDFNELSGSFGRPTKTGIHGASRLAKAFKNGNKVDNVPVELSEYRQYIQHTENYKWIKWQMEGQNYIEITDNCPYCVTNIESKKEKITRISEIYDPKSVENLNKIVEIFRRLDKYFSERTKTIINGFITNINGYSDEQVAYLREIKEQIERLNGKFTDAKHLSFQSLKDVDEVIEKLTQSKIDLTLYNHLESENTKTKTDIVNASIDTILEKAGLLQGKVIQQKKHIEKLIKNNKGHINSFLQNAGYKYSVDLFEGDNGDYQLKLIHNDIVDEVKDVKNHLSFGEKNAFALVLFMFDALNAEPDLIILDDPISSFDKNKKYAIIDMLFRKSNSFRDKTVLLLTHDFQPIVDMMHHHRNRFSIPTATFLENINGVLNEKVIERSDIKTFIEINHTNIQELAEDLRKLVYLRRLYEVTNNQGLGYHMISSLLHKRDKPDIKSETSTREMTEEEIKKGVREIQCHIVDFDYQQLLSQLKNDTKMKSLYLSTDNNYEKLHIYRIIFDDKEQGVDSDIIVKFINEAFHIENDYIYQLNPRKYQMVPEYVIQECNRLVNEV